MKRIGILTAGGDTPALNATLFGAVTRANELGVQMIGVVKGFDGLLDPRCPHLPLNPLNMTIPELDPCHGGTILGASRTYVDADDAPEIAAVTERLGRLSIEGLVCVGGDGTINGMQPLSERFPCVLAPKTIDNDLGLNYLDEPNEWL
ncbi:MAG: 6-phosphofructokinase, partial [Planctomycetaceae bacterium]